MLSETASPGYYAVDLLDWDVKAELTATMFGAVHRYTYYSHEQGKEDMFVLLPIRCIGHGFLSFGQPRSDSRGVPQCFCDNRPSEKRGHRVDLELWIVERKIWWSQSKSSQHSN